MASEAVEHQKIAQFHTDRPQQQTDLGMNLSLLAAKRRGSPPPSRSCWCALKQNLGAKDTSTPVDAFREGDHQGWRRFSVCGKHFVRFTSTLCPLYLIKISSDEIENGLTSMAAVSTPMCFTHLRHTVLRLMHPRPPRCDLPRQ